MSCTKNNLDILLQHLKAKFKVSCNENISLYIIIHYNEQAIDQLEKGKTILLKQLTEETIKIVTK